MHSAHRSGPGTIALIVAILSATSCRPVEPDASHPVAEAFEGGARDAVAPDRFDTLALVLKQTSVIARGTVTDITHVYDDCEGPRTLVRLSSVRALVGADPGGEIELRTFGGPLPNGNYVSASELPLYVKGATYVVFLRNTDWRFSPVMGDLAFREETIAGRPVLIDSDGFGVSGVGNAGIERNTAQLTEPATASPGGQVQRVVARPINDPGAILRCEAGTTCRAARAAPDAGDRSNADLPGDLASSRSGRPAVLPDVDSADVAAALSADDLTARIGRAAAASRLQIGGRLQLRPRLGCWKVTPTDPWRRKSS